MARYRSIQTNFWQDNFIVKLPLVEKGFYSYILTNCRTTQCGIYNFSIIFTAIELGCSEEEVKELINKFIAYGKILYDEVNEEIMILNWYKYNLTNSRNTLVCVNRELQDVKSKAFIKRFYELCKTKKFPLEIIFDGIDVGGEVSLEQGLNNYLSLLELRYKGEGAAGGYGTGLKLVDDFAGGFQKQDLVILAARPSMGKSAVALNMAVNMALDKGLSTAVFQLEMNQNSIIERIVSNRASIPMNSLKKGRLSEEEWVGIMEVTNRLAVSNLTIFDDVYSLKEIRSECKRLKLKKGLDVVFIDYLQLIDNGSSKRTRNEDVSEISRGLKLLAKELDITIVVLSQLSRAPETRNDHRPYLSDLRDSGSIEQDADMVIFLYRDSYYNRENEDEERIEIIIAKNRNGETGTIKARWQGSYQRVTA